MRFRLLAMVVLAGVVCGVTLVGSPVFVETALAQGTDPETLPVTWSPVYAVDRTTLPPDVVAAYMANPDGTIAATIQALDQAQTWIDEQGIANPLNLRMQVYAHIRSVPMVEAAHYLEQRAAERGVTRANDPKFFASLDVLRNGGI